MKKTDSSRIYRAILGGLISSGVELRELTQFLEELRAGRHDYLFRSLLRDVRRLSLEDVSEPLLVVELNDRREDKARTANSLLQFLKGRNRNEIERLLTHANPQWKPPKRTSGSRALVVSFVDASPSNLVASFVRDLSREEQDPYLSGIINRDRDKE